MILIPSFVCSDKFFSLFNCLAVEYTCHLDIFKQEKAGIGKFSQIHFYDMFSADRPDQLKFTIPVPIKRTFFHFDACFFPDDSVIYIEKIIV